VVGAGSEVAAVGSVDVVVLPYKYERQRGMWGRIERITMATEMRRYGRT